MRVLVCGGRNFTDCSFFKRFLDDSSSGALIHVVIHG